MSLFKVVSGKTCHLLVEIQRQTYWAVKACHLDLEEAGKEGKLQLQELENVMLTTYEKSKFYKEKTKKIHDQKLVAKKDFNIGQKVVLYKSRIGPMSDKLRSKWKGPFIIT